MIRPALPKVSDYRLQGHVIDLLYICDTFFAPHLTFVKTDSFKCTLFFYYSGKYDWVKRCVTSFLKPVKRLVP